MVVLLDPNENVDDILRKNRTREKHYAFDHVFGQQSNQDDVFQNTCKFLLEGILEGLGIYDMILLMSGYVVMKGMLKYYVWLYRFAKIIGTLYVLAYLYR